MVLTMKLALTTQEGNVLPAKSETAPANYILNSYFSGSQCFFNGMPLNSSKVQSQKVQFLDKICRFCIGDRFSSFQDYHHYKSMLFTTITNNQSEFQAPLEAAGYVYQGSGFEDTPQSGSFQIRANWFRTDPSSKVYHKNPVPFCGTLITDLTTADVGCPPVNNTVLILG